MQGPFLCVTFLCRRFFRVRTIWLLLNSMGSEKMCRTIFL